MKKYNVTYGLEYYQSVLHKIVTANSKKEAKEKVEKIPQSYVFKVEEVMFDELNEIKSQLFDAPSEIKEAFNEVVSYFDGLPLSYKEFDFKILDTKLKRLAQLNDRESKLDKERVTRRSKSQDTEDFMKSYYYKKNLIEIERNAINSMIKVIRDYEKSK